MIETMIIIVLIFFVVSNLVLGILSLYVDKDLRQRQAALREMQRRWQP